MVSMVAMAVDVAASPDGQKLAIVGLAGNNGFVGSSGSSQVTVLNKSDLTPSDGCRFPSGPSPTAPSPDVQVTAIAYDGTGQLWAQARNPAQLLLLSTGAAKSIPLTGAEDRASEGHRLFHTPTRGMIACASCHAEGGDDGHVWTFDTVGPRRTQSLRGGILATAPFHWDGELQDVKALMHEVFAGRMAGGELTSAQSDAVGKWLDAQPPLPKPAAADPAAVERGKALFQDATVACASCHSGSHLTSNRNETVGTGKSFQVPGLTDLALRAPYMHNGCAPTLRARFDPACGGGDSHGKTSQLTANQLSDLVQYLETL
jgi:cytochrome c peroxidase